MSADAAEDGLREAVRRLADLAAEHLNCTGCPTPWWLTRWLHEAADLAEHQPTARGADLPGSIGPRCGVRHPTESGVSCQRLAGHVGTHRWWGGGDSEQWSTQPVPVAPAGEVRQPFVHGNNPVTIHWDDPETPPIKAGDHVRVHLGDRTHEFVVHDVQPDGDGGWEITPATTEGGDRDE